jgi:hypothetical protein
MFNYSELIPNTITVDARDRFLQSNKLAAVAHEAFLEYVNDFVTIAGFAEYYHLPNSYARALINYGRKLHYCEVEAFPHH